MLTEDNLPDAFQTAVSTIDPPTVDLVEGGMAHGHRLRRRKHARLAGAATSLAVLAIGVGIGVSNLAGGPAAAPAAGAVGSASATTATAISAGPTVAATPTSQPTPTRPAEPPAYLRPAEAEIVSNLTKLLPAGLTVSRTSGQSQYAQLVATDSHGSVLLEVNVQPGNADQSGLFTNCFTTGLGSDDRISCQPSTLADGDKLLTSEESFVQNGVTMENWIADLGRVDGLRVVISEWNTDNGMKSTSRSTQTLSIAQLSAIVESPLWTAN